MFKHTRLLVPAVLAAGTMLLTACDDGGANAGAAEQNTPTSTSSSATTGTSTEGTADATAGGATADGGSTDSAKDCGEATVGDGPTLLLIPDKGELGYLTCDQLHAVFNEFSRLATQGEMPGNGVTVDNDWQCVPASDDDVTVGVDCFTPAVSDANNPADYQFHAQPK